MSKQTYDLVDKLIDYEQGNLTPEQDVELIQHLVDTGEVWHLQGHYGRLARFWIDNGIVTPPARK